LVLIRGEGEKNIDWTANKIEAMIAVSALVLVMGGYLLGGDDGIFIAGAIMMAFFMLLGAIFLLRSAFNKSSVEKEDKGKGTLTIIALEIIGVIVILLFLWRASVL
jgi:hypothetical protein